MGMVMNLSMQKSKGKLVRWLGNKGFGFIKPEQGKDDIFIHISALKGMSRKPIVGDIVHYEISLDANGKTRAVNARIEGVEQVLSLTPIKKSSKAGRSTQVNKRTYRKSTEVEKSLKSWKRLLVLMLFILGVALNVFQEKNVDLIFTPYEEPGQRADNGINQRLASAYKNQQSDVQVTGIGTVIRILSDDTKGSQHQRFILKLASGQTLLIAHNIDLAPRINSLRVGDSVEFYGEYEWNSKGGVLHWTHNDPGGYHENGWLKHNGSTYQ